TPVIAGRHQDEGKKAARERLRFIAQPFVDAAAPVLAQEDATAIAAVVQMVTTSPPGAARLEKRQTRDDWITLPTLGLDLAALFVADGHDVFFAAASAGVAIPVLDYRQTSKRK